jgi:hypothetical protein
MKKVFLAFMAIATIALVGCKKNNDPVPVPTPTPDTTDVPVEEDIPEVEAPAEGYVTFVIQIPKGTECNGIAFKGTLNGGEWTGANQYLGLEGPASPESCIKFEKIEGNWYKATYKLGTEPWGDNGTLMAGKLCLIYTDDGSWEGQAVNWSINDEYSTADNGKSNDGNIEVYGSGLLYVTIGAWQASECVIPVEYNITVKVPEFCGEPFPMIVIGSFCSWGEEGAVHLELVEGNTYKASIIAAENAQWKIRHEVSWQEGEILVYRTEDDPATTDFDETDTWGGCENNVLGAETDVVVDYTDPAKYRWNICE